MHVLSTIVRTLLLGALALVYIGLMVTPAEAQADQRLSASVNGMTVTASIERSTPCTGYTLSWGDGEELVIQEIDEVCIEVIVTEQQMHTYEEAGEYTITLTMNDTESTTTVEVPGEVIEFTIDDVVSISSEWVDPFEQMADEEYYLYSITLNDGTEVTVQTAGFTTIEYRDEQFINAGYTGDVSALIALADTDDAAEPDAPTAPVDDASTEETRKGLYQQIVTLLQSLVALLQSR